MHVQEIQRLEQLLKEAFEMNKQQLEAEVNRGLQQKAAAEAAHSDSVRALEERYTAATETHRADIARMDKLYADALQAHKQQLDAEVARKLEALKAEAQMRQQLESDHEASIKLLREKHDSELALMTESNNKEISRLEQLLRSSEEANQSRIEAEAKNHAREVAALEKLLGEAVENGKSQTEQEAERGKRQLQAAEAAYTTMFDKAEEAHAALVNSLRLEIARLEHLHRSSEEKEKSLLESHEKISMHSSDIVQSAEEQHRAALTEAEVKHSEELLSAKKKVKEATEARDKHKADLTASQSEVSELKQQLASMNLLKEKHDSEVALMRESHSKEISRLEQLLRSSEEANQSRIEAEAKNHAREVASLQKLLGEAVENGKSQAAQEAERGKRQLQAAEAAYTTMFAKAEEVHAALVESLRLEIARLEHLHRSSQEKEKSLLESHEKISMHSSDIVQSTEEQHRASLTEAEVKHSEELLSAKKKVKEATEARDKHKADLTASQSEVSELKQQLASMNLLKEKHDSEVALMRESHSKEISRLEQLLRSSEEANQSRIEAEAKNHAREVAALEKLLGEAVENGRSQAEQEAERGKLQLQAAEAAHTTMFAKAEEAHAALADSLRLEIARLEHLHRSSQEKEKSLLEAHESDIVRSSAEQHRTALTEAEVKHSEELLSEKKKVKEATEARDKHKADLTAAQSEVADLKKAIAALEQELAKRQTITLASDDSIAPEQNYSGSEAQPPTGVVPAQPMEVKPELSNAEEAHATLVEGLRSEIARLEQLHLTSQEREKSLMESHETDIARSAEEQHRAALTEAEVKHSEELLSAKKKVKEATEARDKHKADLTASQSEVSELKQQLASMNLLKEKHDSEVALMRESHSKEISRLEQLLRSSEEANQSRIEAEAKNHAREVASLQKLLGEAVENGKSQAAQEAERGKRQLQAAEAAYTTMFAKAEEAHAALADSLRSEIARLEHLHHSSEEKEKTLLGSLEKISMHSSDMVQSAEEQHRAALTEAEVKHSEELLSAKKKVKEATEARDKHKADLTVAQSEVADLKQQLASMNHSKETHDPEVALLRENVKEATEARDKLKADLVTAQSEVADLKKKIAVLEQELAKRQTITLASDDSIAPQQNSGSESKPPTEVVPTQPQDADVMVRQVSQDFFLLLTSFFLSPGRQ